MRRNSVNPVNMKGLRILDCPFYRDCLMYAAKLNWEAWSCEQCSNRRLHTIYQKIKLITPYYKIMAEIYPEFKRKYETVMNSLELEA